MEHPDNRIVSILIPCRNEEDFVEACLTSVRNFEVPPQVSLEIVVIDGQSSDSTREIVRRMAQSDPRIALIDNPGLTQACALNLAIPSSRGTWIMRLDAHTIYPTNYLVQCFETAVRTGAANVGGICITRPGGSTYEAELVQALTTHKFGVGDSGFRTGAAEGERDTVPFGFFRREIFDRIGYFDQRLVRAQDYEFNRRIRAAGSVIWLNPAIQSEYFNQRRLWGFYRKQIVHEAPYNAYMWYLAPYAFAPRHAITGVFSAGVLGGCAVSFFSVFLAWAFLGVMTLYAALAVLSAGQQAVRYRRPTHLLALPPCFFLFHFLHGLGVLWGLLRIATQTAPVQQVREPWPGAGRTRAWPIK